MPPLTRPKISVVIPTYNRSALACRAVESVLSQTLAPDEVIVVDDGSTDGTDAVLADRFGNRIVYVRQENGGVSAARNTGIERAGGDLVAFLDSDDVWMPNKLELQVPVMADTDVVLSATNWAWEGAATADQHSKILLGTREKVLVEDEPLSRLCWHRGHGINIQTCICRRDLLQHLGGFDTNLRISEDMDLIFRMADEGKFAILSDILLIRGGNENENNLTRPESSEWFAENLDNIIRILERVQADPRPRSRDCLRALARRILQLRTNRARLYARTGDLANARRQSWGGLQGPVLARDTLVCAAGAIWPRLLRLRRS